MLKEWEKAPGFNTLDYKSEEISNKAYLGKYCVVYFYPKAFTPGCTRENNDFSGEIDSFCKLDFSGKEGKVTDFSAILEMGAEVIGISQDSPEVLAKFRERYNLKVDLLSDSRREIARSFGALKGDGKGILRSTFILDRWGRVRKSWYDVKVDGHVGEVLSTLKGIVVKDLSINPQIAYRKARRGINSAAIPREEIKQIIRAAHLAPSCFNKQPWRFTVIDDKETLKELHEGLSGGNYWMKNAPALVAVHSQKKSDCVIGDREYYLFDTGLAIGFLLLQATQMGIIAHPAAGFKPEFFKKVLNIPENHNLIAVVALGYERDMANLNEDHQEREKSPRDRKGLEEILFWNNYQNTN